MAKLLQLLNPETSAYRDRRFDGTQSEYEAALRTSVAVYVGNLSFFTTEDQLYEVFSKVGDVRRVIMGLDKRARTPCGFCFVLYRERRAADACVKFINGTLLDGRPIRVDHDWALTEESIYKCERQFGRGRSGGQVRDEFRTDFDPGRGGYGHILEDEVKAIMARHQYEQQLSQQAGAEPQALPAAPARPEAEAADVPPAKRRNVRREDSDEEEG